jgi:hypothetical protein
MPRKARVFIASSGESLNVAYGIQENLGDVAEVTVWDQNAFELSAYALESLLKVLRDFEFIVCVCTPTDRSTIRGERVDVSRDNVIFELGLFIGRHGRERCFVVQPIGVSMHLPSDFAGIMTARYDPHRSDNNLRAALGPACNQMREQIKAHLKAGDDTSLNAKVRNIAVVCYKMAGPNVEVLLTRTSGGRWIIPKGRRAKGQSVGDAIQTIARIESGAVGRVDLDPIASFRYLKNEANQEQRVTAFLLEVERVEDVAQSFRSPSWFELRSAADRLAENRGAIYAQEFRAVFDKVAARVRTATQAGAL